MLCLSTARAGSRAFLKHPGQSARSISSFRQQPTVCKLVGSSFVDVEASETCAEDTVELQSLQFCGEAATRREVLLGASGLVATQASFLRSGALPLVALAYTVTACTGYRTAYNDMWLHACFHELHALGWRPAGATIFLCASSVNSPGVFDRINLLHISAGDCLPQRISFIPFQIYIANVDLTGPGLASSVHIHHIIDCQAWVKDGATCIMQQYGHSSSVASGETDTTSHAS